MHPQASFIATGQLPSPESSSSSRGGAGEGSVQQQVVRMYVNDEGRLSVRMVAPA